MESPAPNLIGPIQSLCECYTYRSLVITGVAFPQSQSGHFFRYPPPPLPILGLSIPQWSYSVFTHSTSSVLRSEDTLVPQLGSPIRIVRAKITEALVGSDSYARLPIKHRSWRLIPLSEHVLHNKIVSRSRLTIFKRLPSPCNELVTWASL